ncbi:hypothetical protein MTR_3g083720 [Medicago truncatula]|uniref:Uncharacterized protein n=1 Tax=Medicago truncatula TaxID=3880 RepID=G7JA51_MEDTR|nr:hypothetical protein MTR_3g083720 [Medicago truncatula]
MSQQIKLDAKAQTSFKKVISQMDDKGIFVYSHVDSSTCYCKVDSFQDQSKRWNQLLSENLFYSLRKSHGMAEEWIYVITTNDGRISWHAFDPIYQRWQTLPPVPWQNHFFWVPPKVFMWIISLVDVSSPNKQVESYPYNWENIVGEGLKGNFVCCQVLEA